LSHRTNTHHNQQWSGIMICICIATKMEAEPFINGLRLTKIENPFFHLYRRDDLLLVITGIGKMNTTMAATFAISTFRPEKILNFGAAGSFANEPIGTVFQVRSIVETDRPVRHLGTERVYTPHTLSGFEDAVLATQDVPVLDPDERRKLAASADLIDMEGCAVAHVCKRFDKPLYLYKFVSDNMEKPELSDIVENIEKYSPSFYQFCLENVFPAHAGNDRK
jgi:adenosylhomocysteine nucleosidase